MSIYSRENIPSLKDIYTQRDWMAVRDAFIEATGMDPNWVEGDSRIAKIDSFFDYALRKEKQDAFIERLRALVPQANAELDRLLRLPEPPPPPSPQRPLRPGLSSAIGSVHIHIDGGADQDIAREIVSLIDPNGERSELVHIVDFKGGPQRAREPQLYATHTPTRGQAEALSFFSTTVLHDGHGLAELDIAIIEDAVAVVLGGLSSRLAEAGDRAPGGVVVEVERPIGLVPDSGEANWPMLPSMKKALGPAFLYRKLTHLLGRAVDVYETHISVDLPYHGDAKPPITLDDLLHIAKSSNIELGGWFLFLKEDSWAYRSNMFSFKLDRGEAIRAQKVFKDELAKIGHTQSTVRVLVEESLGVWRNPFQKADPKALSVPELIVWERNVRPGSEFRVVTGNFLGDQHVQVRDAMLQNIANKVTYKYFLRSFADLVRWIKFKDEFIKENPGTNKYLKAYVFEFTAVDIWEEKLDCFIVYEPTDVGGCDATGYKLERHPLTRRVTRGSPMSEPAITAIGELLERMVENETIVSSRRLTNVADFEAAVIWLDFGYFDAVGKRDRFVFNYASLQAFDQLVASLVSQTGGEVIEANQSRYVIIIPKDREDGGERGRSRVGAICRSAMLGQQLTASLDQFDGRDAMELPYRLVLGYDDLHRTYRSNGCAVVGELLEWARLAVTQLEPGANYAFSAIVPALKAEMPDLGFRTTPVRVAGDSTLVAFDWPRRS